MVEFTVHMKSLNKYMINKYHNSIPWPNSSIVLVASVRISTKALNDARRNLASVASKCLNQKK